MRSQFSALASIVIVGIASLLVSCGGRESRLNSSAERSMSSGEQSAPIPQSNHDSYAAPADTTTALSAQPLSSDRHSSSEEYARVFENDFMNPTNNPLSTFAIDVDPASYSNVRRVITDGAMPQPDAVRIEELVNYFDYDYPRPTGNEPFSLTTEVSECPWNKEHRLVHIGLQGREVKNAVMPPANLVFLVDVSGSMDTPDKLPLVKASLQLLVKQLRPQDRVAIAVYAGAAGLALPSTPGSEKSKIFDAIDRLEAGGSTAGGEGIMLAYKVAQDNFITDGNNRVILATDGDFNVGISDEMGLQSLIEAKRRERVFLTVLGFGDGNLKDSRMELLADKGNGNYAYIDGINEARKVFVNELGGTILAIAKDVKIQVEFNPALVGAYRLVGYENRALAAHEFNDDTKDAGELGAGHSVTALYEIVPAGATAGRPRVDRLKYQSSAAHPELYGSGEMLTVKLRYKEPYGEVSRKLERAVVDKGISLERSSDNMRFSAAVASWGMLLRNSKYRGNASYEDVIRLARGAQGKDQEGYRAEFIALVEASRALARPM